MGIYSKLPFPYITQHDPHFNPDAYRKSPTKRQKYDKRQHFEPSKQSYENPKLQNNKRSHQIWKMMRSSTVWETQCCCQFLLW